MEIKVGQIYKGNKSGRERRVIKQLKEDLFLLENVDGVEWESKWSTNDLQKTCTLVKDVVDNTHPWW